MVDRTTHSQQSIHSTLPRNPDPTWSVSELGLARCQALLMSANNDYFLVRLLYHNQMQLPYPFRRRNVQYNLLAKSTTFVVHSVWHLEDSGRWARVTAVLRGA